MSTPHLFMVELVVADADRSARWYHRFLDRPATMRDRINGFALFIAGGFQLALRQPDRIPVLPADSTPPGVRLVFEVEDLDAALLRLAGHGILPDGPRKVSDEGYARVFVRDPDGYRVGLFQWLIARPDLEALESTPEAERT